MRESSLFVLDSCGFSYLYILKFNHVWMALQPAIVFRLMGIEVIEDDMNVFFVIVRINDAIHEIQEFPAGPAFAMDGLN
jgi:hypothetical protein